jgi:hypothetical protein
MIRTPRRWYINRHRYFRDDFIPGPTRFGVPTRYPRMKLSTVVMMIPLLCLGYGVLALFRSEFHS